MTVQEHLPADQNAARIQVLGADDSTLVAGTIGATASALTIPSGSRVIELNTAIAAHVKFGASGQSAATTSSRYLPAGSYVYKVLTGQAEVSVIRAASEASTGPITIVRMV